MKKLSFLLSLLLLISCHRENQENTKPILVDSLYEKAWFFKDKDIIDSSFIYFNIAKEAATHRKDSIKVAKCLINMAVISVERGDYFSGQDISLSAITYLDSLKQDEKELLSSTYNELGKASHSLKNYEEAGKFYIKALNLTSSDKSKVIYINNIANNHTYQRQYNKAISYYKELMAMKVITSNENNYARILSNYAKTKWLENSNYNPAPIFLKVLQMRLKQNDLLGQNASYAHLSSYYTYTKPDSALFYAKEMYNISKKISSPDDQLQALQKLIKLSRVGDSKRYFERYQELNDSVQIARDSSKNQFALIRYETEKHKADNFLLKQENTIREYQILILVSSSLLILIIGIFWYKKRKQRLEIEAKNTIKENQLKTSKKVHDVVANGLYRIMTKLDNVETLKDNPIVDEIEELYEKSRDISYEKEPLLEQNFNEKISTLLKSFASHDTKVLIVGNELKLWAKISDQVKYELEHILQELMVNMKKHSKANTVVIKFEELNNQIIINYTDDGIGLAKGTSFNNGLKNTGNRINSISGKLNFEQNMEKGLKINMTFPIT